MPNEIEAMKSFLEGSNAVADIEREIIKITGCPPTFVRENIQKKAAEEAGNQFSAAQKWLEQLRSK